MKGRIITKGLTAIIVLLFIGLAIQPSVTTVELKEEIIDVESKDYLFQTIIDIANNPNVKNLIERDNNDFFKVDIDCSVYLKILFRNPRLFHSMIFTKPSLTPEYLDKNYNFGLEIKSILGEDKLQEIIESIKVTDKEVFNKLNSIIINNEELSSRIKILKEINNGVNPIISYGDLICGILTLTFAVSGMIGIIISSPIWLSLVPFIWLEIFFDIDMQIFAPLIKIIEFILTPFYLLTGIFVFICIVSSVIGWSLDCPLWEGLPHID